jgi:uncharacterized protein with von Willebrand factor type A (vWA) domain
MAASDPIDAPGLSTAVLRFVHRLREASVPVSMVEAIDAFTAIAHLDLEDREQFRSALRATLVKQAAHEEVFDRVFDTYFAVSRSGAAEPPQIGTSLDRAPDEAGADADGDAILPTGDPTDILAALLDALRNDDEEALAMLARLAVAEHAGIDPDRPGSERYYTYRVLRQLDLSQLLLQALLQARAEGLAESDLEDRLVREDLANKLEAFRRSIAREVRKRLVEVRGEEAADLVLDPRIEEVAFLRASPAELRAMQEAIRPLARKLAARIAHRRKLRHRGRLDVRRTVRRSLSTGGVPLDPVFRYPRTSRPDLYLLCDISGSVAEFARFTMSLLLAMKREFARVRLFVFVDGVDEVTDVMREDAAWIAPRNLLYGTNAIAGDGHSDYGAVFQRFWELYGYADLDARSTVIVTGDARTNYRSPRVDAFRNISEQARHVYWLNPEPIATWNTTDSVMELYEPDCTDAFESSNLGQLAEFVLAIT